MYAVITFASPAPARHAACRALAEVDGELARIRELTASAVSQEARGAWLHLTPLKAAPGLLLRLAAPAHPPLFLSRHQDSILAVSSAPHFQHRQGRDAGDNDCRACGSAPPENVQSLKAAGLGPCD